MRFHLTHPLLKINFFRRCNPKNLTNAVVIPYSHEDVGKFIGELMIFLKKRGVEREHLKFIRNKRLGRVTENATYKTKMREYLETRIRNSPFLLEILIRTYYTDFLLFNYPIPTLDHLINFK